MKSTSYKPVSVPNPTTRIPAAGHVTDRPYPEMVKALITVHKRLLAVHSGKATPVNRRPRASEAGTPSYRLSDAF